MKKKAILLIMLIAVVGIGVIISGYFLLTYLGKCDSKTCFNDALVSCKRASYFLDTSETSMEYKILGKSGDACRVEVKLVQFKRGTADLAVLEGKSMTCSTPLGILVQPESDLSQCHGILKEEIQDMIIKRMHAQIIENIGKIGEEVTKVL